MAIPENGEKSIDGEDEIKREVPSTQEEKLAVNSRRDVVVRGGYNTDHPPEDDCCPICFDSFQFPCRTNCGHWYCGSCFLQLWRHTKDFKWCNCPMCGCVVKKLIPHSSKLIPPEEDGRKILKDIRGYNYQNVRRWFAFFLEVLTMLLLPLRSLPPEGHGHRRMMLFLCTVSHISLIFSLAIFVSRFGFIPSWFEEIMFSTLLFWHVILTPLTIVFLCDEMWFRRRRRARQLVQAQALLHLE